MDKENGKEDNNSTEERLEKNLEDKMQMDERYLTKLP